MHATTGPMATKMHFPALFVQDHFVPQCKGTSKGVVGVVTPTFLSLVM